MSDSELQERADQRFQDALADTGARDPREFYRKLLRDLRTRNAAAYQRAVDYHDTRLVPAVAEENSRPLEEWLEYGRFLACLLGDGHTVQIDTSGRAHEYHTPVPGDHLVLHLPTATRERAIVIGLPPELSPAQRATYNLLVVGKVR